MVERHSAIAREAATIKAYIIHSMIRLDMRVNYYLLDLAAACKLPSSAPVQYQSEELLS
jgi:hypothetical protein